MFCKIYVSKETDNPDGICDDCKFCIIDDKDIPPNMWFSHYEIIDLREA